MNTNPPFEVGQVWSLTINNPVKLFTIVRIVGDQVYYDDGGYDFLSAHASKYYKYISGRKFKTRFELIIDDN